MSFPTWDPWESGGAAAGSGAYSRPTPDDIKRRTGVNEKMDNLTSDQLSDALTGLLSDAETRTALAVTEAVWNDGTISALRMNALALAVSYRTGADYLRTIASEKVTGTQSPRAMEQAEALRAQADALESDAERYDRLAAGTGGDEAAPSGPLPYLITVGIEPGTITELPSERIRDLDERDDVNSGQLSPVGATPGDWG